MFVPIARRYVFRVFAKYLALSLSVFASMLLMLNFVQMVNSGALAGFSFYFLGKSIACLLPNILGTSLPLAFLLAMLLSLGQMSQDGEIVALRAGGFSFSDIFTSISMSAAACVLLLLVINNWVGPVSLKRSADYTTLMINRVTKIDLKPRTFHRISDWVLYARDVNGLSGQMRGVKLVRRLEDGDTPSFVLRLNAANGRYRVESDRGLAIELFDGQFSQADCRDASRIVHGDFASYSTMLPFFPEGGQARKTYPRELSTAGLLARLRAGGMDPGVADKYRIEAASRFALALAPLAFFLIGAPLGVALDKHGRSAGFALSLLLIFFYYGLTMSGMMLCRKYHALFPWAIFVPAVLSCAVGAALWKRRLAGR